jgi:hypothetical protein
VAQPVRRADRVGDPRQDAVLVLGFVPRRAVGDEEEVELGVGSERWTSLALAVGERRPKGVERVHVMDPEGDGFERLAELDATEERWVV